MRPFLFDELPPPFYNRREIYQEATHEGKAQQNHRFNGR